MDENLLATAATNGVVVTWNLGKPSRNKQDQLFTEHKRTVNKVCFHPHRGLHAAQRLPGRIHEVLRPPQEGLGQHLLRSVGVSVRDVQFSIRDYFTFAATFENGNVQLWDIRRPDRFERMFTAHNGPVFCCDWHPEDRGWLATGGRDKMVKVWGHEHQPGQRNLLRADHRLSRPVKWRPGEEVPHRDMFHDGGPQHLCVGRAPAVHTFRHFRRAQGRDDGHRLAPLARPVLHALGI
ncbi:unnamed protein product [Ranitomeya imitator]|uniref:GATOR2 complex protein WDR24 n=1 Tax=Ranitomeya imitator TaxID=111125 RepID=A0ABN9LZR1_9NEOB|nr:unnamed protein product [Ranitomeya imitator]